MITLYHLGVSQSDRIVWLLEELQLPYKLQWFDRGPDQLAPREYRDLHPVGTAPIIRDGDLVLSESAAICEYLSRKHAGGALSLGPDHPNFADYLYWMQFNGNVQSVFFARMAVNSVAEGSVPATGAMPMLQRREDAYYTFLNEQLGKYPYLAGDELTCADIMCVFNLTSLSLFGGRKIDDLPNVTAYLQRIKTRPAYIKAMEIAGPNALAPKAN